jgi:hypothetical protein
MNCPYCGNELSGKDVCARCGKKTEMPKPKVEVEYKEFKVSEFLEIRQKQEVLQAEKESSGSTETDFRVKREDVTKETRPDVKREKRNVFLIAAIILVIITAMAGTWYLLRFFLK